MKNTWFRIFILSIVAGLFSCSSNDTGVNNPNLTEEAFNNPSGKLTSSNAQAVTIGAAYGIGSLLMNNPEGIFALETPPSQTLSNLNYSSACVKTSGNKTTIDWNCVFLDQAQCAASGTTVTTVDTDNKYDAVDYNDFSILCNASQPTELGIDCDGTINVSTKTSNVYCSDISCTFDGLKKSFEGCRNSSGYILVKIVGESYVAKSVEPNDACTSVTAIIVDSSGSKTVVCDITSHETPCSTAADINKIANCVIQ